MKKLLLLFAIPVSLYSQNIGINTQNPDASAALEIQSTDAGILIPRMSEAQRNLIASPATGLLVYQTDGASGFYFLMEALGHRFQEIQPLPTRDLSKLPKEAILAIV